MFIKYIKEFKKRMAAYRDYLNSAHLMVTQKLNELLKDNLDIPSAAYLKELKDGYEKLPIDERDQYIKNRQVEVQERFGKDTKINKTEDEKNIVIKLTGKLGERAHKYINSVSHELLKSKIMYESNFVTLVSIVEYFLSNGLREYFNEVPESCNFNEKCFSYKQLKDIGSIEEAKSMIISDKIEQIFRSGFDDWLELLRKDLHMDTNFIDKDFLQEIFMRRNIFVHNDGIVNHIYLSKVKNNRFEYELNQYAKLSKSYIGSSTNILEKSFIVIVLKLWSMALDKNQKTKDEYYETIDMLNYQYLKEEKWVVAKGISELLMTDKKANEIFKFAALINYYQCCKWLNEDWKKYEREFEKIDFSAKAPMFRLASYALLDKYSEFEQCFKKHIGQDGVTYYALDEWPIYKGIRATQVYETICQSPEYIKYKQEKIYDINPIIDME